MTDQLTQDDLQKVRKAVWPACNEWSDIGIELGLDYATLEKIKAEKCDIKACLTHMLHLWLDPRSSLHPTWSALVDALKSITVGYGELAEHIRTIHIEPHQAASTESHQASQIEATASIEPLNGEQIDLTMLILFSHNFCFKLEKGCMY